MHILMLCALEVWALPSGGGAPTLYRTLRAYSERGHRVTFVTSSIGANAHLPGGTLRGATPTPPPNLPGLTFERFHLPSLQELRLPLPPFVTKADQKLRFALLFPRLASERAERVLRRDPADVLYGYEVHGVLAARRLRKHNRLPTVARFQGTVMYPSLGSTLARLRRREEIQALRTLADLYIMTNDGTRGDEVLARVNPGALTKLRFWRNGLDTERLQPFDAPQKAALRQGLGLPGGALILLTASRLATWKRVDRAIAALPHVLAAAPNALLVIVGDGEERANLERQATELGVAARVRFVGAVPQDRVVEYMQATDVLLALADLSNVGNPLLEAMCCGLAIVAVDAGDTGQLIRDRETGRLLPLGNASEVTDAIVELSDIELRNRLATAARRYAEEHFWTWDDRLRAEIDEVERLVGNPAEERVPDVAR
jgi:glycosyltransferase involved in cell wall biosynthesis